MKKPEITKGEWMYSNGQITEQEGYSIAEYVSEHDGQAISAVPEMIDALVESTKLLEHLKSVETESELIHEIEQQIEMNKYSALKKAGCGE